jgi:hypothetical protein
MDTTDANRGAKSTMRIRETKSKSKPMKSTRRLTLFGRPPLLENEDAHGYDEFLAHIRLAVEPADFIDEILVVDVVVHEWEVLRWCRLKVSLMRLPQALRNFLTTNLDYDEYSEQFVEHFAEILKENLPEDKADKAQELASMCARNEPTVKAIKKVFKGMRFEQDFPNTISMDEVLYRARKQKAEELVKRYMRDDANAVMTINKFLVNAGVTVEQLIAGELRDSSELDYIERIDRLAAIAESRRNASLRGIEQRRAVLGRALRRSVQEVEDAEFKVIEASPAKGDDAA